VQIGSYAYSVHPKHMAKIPRFPHVQTLVLSLAVSGDTPMSLLVHLVLLSGPLTLSKADLEQLASCLNSLKSAAAFSSVTVRALHLMQIAIAWETIIATYFNVKKSLDSRS